MRFSGRLTGGLPLLFIVVLSVFGVAYSHWSDTVVIEGTVEMGELIVGILSVECGEIEDKDVGSITCTLKEPETSTHHTPQQTVYKRLEVNITDAYPQYVVWINATVKNAGTIPARLQAIRLVEARDEKDGEDLTVTFDPDNLNGTVEDPVHGAIINYRLELDPRIPTTILGWQLEPCTEYWVKITIDFKQEAEECHTYKFVFEVEFIQWNKYKPPTPPCEWKWVSPINAIDNGTLGENWWEYETDIMDDDLSTTAFGLVNPGYVGIANLTLVLSGPKMCRGVRFYAYFHTKCPPGKNNTRVYVYDVDSGGWVNVYEGEYYNATWTTIMFPERMVSRACICFDTVEYYNIVYVSIGEFDFYVCDDS